MLHNKKRAFHEVLPKCYTNHLTFGGAFLLAKFTEEEKMRAVKRYLDGNRGCNTIAKEIGVHVSKLQYWVKKYEYHGDKAFIKTYTKYSTQDKLDILNYMNVHGTSIFDTAARFNLSSDSILWQWQNSLVTEGITALDSKKKGRPSMKKDRQKPTKKQTTDKSSVEELQAEIDNLRMENAYLKKLNALVQKKEALQQKTRR